MNILDYIGYVFGYVIFFGYKISGVYVVGLLLFTIVVKLLLLPSSLKQQKTSAKQARLAPKLKELQEMYKNNPTKLQEEQSALYARENVSMMSGCLPLLIQFPIIIGLYRAIVNPLTCVLHLSVDKVNRALEFITVSGNSYYKRVHSPVCLGARQNCEREHLYRQGARRARRACQRRVQFVPPQFA